MSHCVKKTALFILFQVIALTIEEEISQLGDLLEHKMQQAQEAPIAPRHWDSQDKQGSELLSALGGQREVCLPGNPNFAQVLQPMESLKTAGLQKAKAEGKISSFKGTVGGKEICFPNLLFEFVSSRRSEFSLFQKLPYSNKTKL